MGRRNSQVFLSEKKVNTPYKYEVDSVSNPGFGFLILAQSYNKQFLPLMYFSEI